MAQKPRLSTISEMENLTRAADLAEARVCDARAVLDSAQADYEHAREVASEVDSRHLHAAVRTPEVCAASAAITRARNQLTAARAAYEKAVSWQTVTRQLRSAEEAGRDAAREISRRLRVPEPVPDTEGYDLKPDPLAAQTAAELVAALREYRVWAGEMPWRKIAAAAGQTVAYSRLFTALRSDELPDLTVVRTLIVGCGGREEELQRWVTAWRRIRMGRLDVRQASARPAPVLKMLRPAAESR